MLIVYFSSTTRNTERFVAKLGLPAERIPLRRGDEPLRVDEPYVLICPTYGGGASITGDFSRPVPKQVIGFLNDEHNRNLIRGVIAGAEGEEQHPVLEAWIWYGKNCLEDSNVDAQQDFAMSEEGRTALLGWLDAKYDEYQAQNA